MPEENYMSKLRRTKGSVVRPSTESVLVKLGKDIEFARRVRGMSADTFAKSAGISRSTLHRLENGNGAGISLNTLAMVLTILGKLDLLSNLIDIRNDDIGLSMLRENVMQGTKSTPKSVKVSTEKRATKGARVKSGKPPAGIAITIKSTLSGEKVSDQRDKEGLVMSSSGRASSLLTRLKAKRDGSGSRSEK
ncbi:helix-turn-helix domain-containing protein [Serratia sp. DD3]|uniref:helix-turn-helix domain-containing protein n=1 Tax=Serratia sp. DD3 TaxID=1410619 RepID=UPI0003C4E4CE|nr:helix-turn-helix transcriptional regulator [Serratia sp. DD3]KEY57015.1 anaerobic benzoate catabolism transcriptional regulator [Serratia sp. DD3]